MGLSQRSDMPLRRIVLAAVAVGLVAMMIVRMRRSPGPPKVLPPHIAEPKPIAEPSPWRDLRERLLSLPRDEPGVRAIVVAFVLAVAGAAGVIGLRNVFPGARFLAPTAQGAQLVSASTGVLDASAACTVIAWTLVISGLLLARWPVRLAGLALLGAGAFAEWHEMGADLSLFSGVPGLTAIAGILVLGLLTVAADLRAARGKKSLDFRGRFLAPMTAVIVVLFVMLAYLGQAARLGGLSSSVARAAWVVELVNIAAVLIVPVLLITGADAADLGGEFARGLAWSLRKTRRAATLTCLIAAAVLAAILVYRGARLLLPALVAVPVFGVITLIAARARPFPRWEKPLPALALAGLVFWLLSAGQVALGVVGTPPPVESVPLRLVVFDPGPPAFSFRAPQACASGATRTLGPPGLAGATVSNCQGLPSFYFEIWTSPGVPKGPCALPGMVLHREGFAHVQYAAAPADGNWRACTVDDVGDHQHGVAWTRSAARRTWMAIALTGDEPGAFQLQAPLLRQMRDSLRQSATTAAPVPVPPRPAGGSRAAATILRNADAAWLALAAVAGLLLTLRKRRQNGQAGTALLYLTCTGAWIGLTGVAKSAAHTKLSGLEVFTLEAGALAAIGTLGYLISLAWNHRRAGRREVLRGRFPDTLGGLLVLDVSLLVIWAAADLYVTAGRSGSSAPIVLGLVLLLALLWELTFSGNMLNPGKPDSPMPHRARVVAYAGFLMLTTAAVLQLATLHPVHAGIFESESVVAAGIVEFGVPFAITFFLVRWFTEAVDDNRAGSPESR
jgi:hypothetical protein